MEGLNVAMRAICEAGIFQGIHLPNRRPLVSYLLHVDESLFVGERSEKKYRKFILDPPLLSCGIGS